MPRVKQHNRHEASPCERCSVAHGRPLASREPAVAAALVNLYPVQRFAFLPNTKYCDKCVADLIAGCSRCGHRHTGMYCHSGPLKGAG